VAPSPILFFVPRATLLCGLLALLSGALALIFDLFGPTYSTASCDTLGHCTTGSASLLQAGLQPVTAVFLIIVALLFLAVFLASLLVATSRASPAIIMLLVCLVLLLLATVLSGFSIGWSFLPADAFTVAALVFARQRPRPRPP
jgi:hypothetical protein